MTRDKNVYFREAVALHYSRKVGDEFVLAFDHPENADGGAVVTNLLSARERLIVDGVRYVNPTGLADSETNYAELKVLQGATVVASWSTKTTGGEGALSAATYVDFTNGAEADRIVEADEELTISIGEQGTTTVPPGRVEVFCRAVPDDITYRAHRVLKPMRVDSVDLKLKSGVAASDTDYYIFQLKAGATVVASWSTKTTGGDGALTAETFAAMTLGADPNPVLAAGDVLDLVCAESGDVVLSDIELTIHGEYL